MGLSHSSAIVLWQGRLLDGQARFYMSTEWFRLDGQSVTHLVN
jgi:hypothetical protein